MRIAQRGNGAELMKDTKTENRKVDAMTCWHFIAPLIPITSDPITIDIYVNTFRAFQLLEKEQLQKQKGSEKPHE